MDERANGPDDVLAVVARESARASVGCPTAVDGADDGSVDVIELRTFLRFLDDENAEDGATDDDDDDDDDAAAAKLFAAHDVDGDARLSAAEFQSALVRWSSEMEEARSLWAVHDDDDDAKPKPEPPDRRSSATRARRPRGLQTVARSRRAPVDASGRSTRREVRSISHLVPIRPRSRGGRRSLRTFAVVSLRPGSLAFDPRPRRLSTPLLTPLNSTPTFARVERP